ncbi:MAG: peptidoglycan-associated lipoprotein Pal [Candidatus Eisenbacteria bacterium]|uniref:Peptidoglycan-associated protein n=1 Tax=Eiseniibacteriota bacterium TaxID=2212470 RepID=A0A538U2D1_UNCEI|nr:MAG: peptidoglycan-associated lipoprotein Pal [Candidatus Eisenbacteria bacterium]
MTANNAWTRLWIAASILVVASLGCAKKEAPLPAAAPPVAQAKPTPPPAPAEQPATTPTTKLIGSGDFQPAFFDLDSYTLREDARAALDKDAKMLRDNPTVNITIEGHCDERGTEEYNQSLGERRAQAAQDYLVAAGISASRLQTISYGKDKPFATGHDDASWQQNRRAHFTVR